KVRGETVAEGMAGDVLGESRHADCLGNHARQRANVDVNAADIARERIARHLPRCEQKLPAQFARGVGPELFFSLGFLTTPEGREDNPAWSARGGGYPIGLAHGNSPCAAVLFALRRRNWPCAQARYTEVRCGW